MELRLVDDEVRTARESQENLVKGYAVMRGYLESLNKRLKPLMKMGDGTGDICVMDAAGYIDITDRKKDMFINGGFNTYPAEIATMLEHQAVGQVTVVVSPMTLAKSALLSLCQHQQGRPISKN